jgi:hypothetical protein
MNQTINEVLDEYAMPVYCESSRRTHESIHELNLTVRASLLWETVILRLRTETITYSIWKAREVQRREEILLSEISRLESETGQSRDMQSIIKLNEAKKDYEEMRQNKLNGAIIRSRARWHEQGGKPSAYFCKLEKRNIISKTISSLRIGQNTVNNIEEIMEFFAFILPVFSSKAPSQVWSNQLRI